MLVSITILSNLEVMMGIRGLCIATMRPLLRYSPCLDAEMASYGNEGMPYKVYKMHMGTESASHAEQEDMDRMDSRAHMLPQRPLVAQVKDETAEDFYVCRQDSMDGA
ncbi:hypothetical protein PMIN06_010496 [Paraphaeosphaeria minitans]|uniref:Uncharacterized protein n=1 Tax=Paraphaeosphaeria minitans TaxID=565426 RepID=A0A9P6GN52_9PLEO|nr:hypothetical protein PMIN01_04050 [Paraphaeosphaeria minitans]